MPISLPADLPAYAVLDARGRHGHVRGCGRRSRTSGRCASALLNLMPKKIQTENQFARLIGATPLQIEFSLIRMTDHETKNTAAEHMESFYRPFAEVEASGEKFDGLIITGAPIEHLRVRGRHLLGRAAPASSTGPRRHVHSTFGVCWGGMAMIHHFHGVQKHLLEAKAFGCVRHENLAPASPYLRGFSDDMVMPVSPLDRDAPQTRSTRRRACRS